MVVGDGMRIRGGHSLEAARKNFPNDNEENGDHL